jgi:hypothetical protein
MGSFWSIFSFMCSVLSIILSVFFIPSHLDYCIVGFIPSHFTIALSVLFLLIWPLHCRFYSSSFDHCIVGSIPSHLTIALSVLFHLIWPFHCQFYSFSFDHSILSVLFLLIWPFHCRFYSFSFDHSIVGFILSHLIIPLSILFLLIWPLHCQFYSFSFDYCIVSFSSIYCSRLSFGYVQTFLPFISRNIPPAPVYEVQMCISVSWYDITIMITDNMDSIELKIPSNISWSHHLESFMVAIMTSQNICSTDWSVCRYRHSIILSSTMTYHRIF